MSPDPKTTRTFLSLGSNTGDRIGNLNNAVKLIERGCGHIEAVSSFYETSPWGFSENSAPFINAALAVRTELSPHDLLERCLAIEKKLGRVCSTNFCGYTSRPIDIDILFFGDIIIRDKKLSIPHPLINSRIFVLEPLAEIAPELIHPEHRKTVEELKVACKDRGKACKLQSL